MTSRDLPPATETPITYAWVVFSPEGRVCGVDNESPEIALSMVRWERMEQTRRAALSVAVQRSIREQGHTVAYAHGWRVQWMAMMVARR